jgi:acyl carrier protein
MIAIEKALSIKFMAHEIEELRNVGDVLDTIEHKLMRGK